MRLTNWWLASLCMVAACGSDNPGIGDLTGVGDPSSATRDGGSSSGRDAGTSRGGGASNGSDECTKHTVAPERATPDMLVVLDRSGSMNVSPNQPTDRWGGSVEAVSEVVQRYDDRVSFGLMTFPAGVAGQRPGQISDALACTPGAIDVAVGPNTGVSIANKLSTMSANGSTPTAATLEVVRKAFTTSAGVDTVVAPKFVLLVTDGDPNCSKTYVNGLPDAEARQQTIKAIDALAKEGVRTYVVGFQTAGTSFAGQLDLMAAAGGTGELKHQSVNSGGDLQDAIEEIASRAVSCSYKLDKPVDDPTYVLVQVKGQSRKYGNAADGWALGPDKQTITLTGAACDAVQDGASFTVEVVCAPVNVI